MLSLSRSFLACRNDNTEFTQEEQDLLSQNSGEYIQEAQYSP
jgi:hypothetical protein